MIRYISLLILFVGCASNQKKYAREDYSQGELGDYLTDDYTQGALDDYYLTDNYSPVFPIGIGPKNNPKEYLMTGPPIDVKKLIIKNGNWTYWYENFGPDIIESKGHYKDGNRDGLWEYWYPNGEKREAGNLNNQERVGKWTYYNEDNSLDIVISY